jgi:hypothetical protein
MPRDASGNYTLPLGNPVIDGTIIDVNWANPTMADIAAQLNNVYTRDGLLGPQAPFKIIDGTENAPGLAFNSEPGLGWYRDGASVIGNAAGGQTVAWLSAASAVGTIYNLFPRSPGTSSLNMSNQARGTPDYNYLNFIQNANGSAIISTQAIGTAVRGDLTIDAPNINIPGNLNVVGVGGISNFGTINVVNLTADNGTIGGLHVTGPLNVDGLSTLANLDVPGLFQVGNISAFGDVIVGGVLTVNGATNLTGLLTAGGITAVGPVNLNSDVTFTGGVVRFINGWTASGGNFNNAGNVDRILYWQSSGSPRWSFITQGIAEGAGNTGNDFLIGRSDNAGAWLGLTLRLIRATGEAVFENHIHSAGSVIAQGNGTFQGVVTSGTQYFNAAAASGGAYRFNAAAGGVGLYSYNWTDLSGTYRDIVLIDASSIQAVSRIHSQYNTGTGINQFTYFVGPVTYTMESSGIAVAQGSWADGSDIRFKAKLAPISNAMAKVRKLSGYTYDRTDLGNVRNAGYIAQEILEVLPEAVTSFHHQGHDAERYAVAGNAVMALLINALKETDVRLAHLESLAQGA